MNENFMITNITRIVFVGKDEYKETKTSFSQELKSNELIFHFSGQANVHVNGKKMETNPNTIRFLPKGKTTGYTVERIERGECIVIFFNTDQPISEEAFVMKCTKSNAVGNLFKNVFLTWVKKDEGYYFECISLLYKIFAELQKKNYIPEKQYQVIKPAVEFIEAHFLDRKITMEDLAECCSVSYSYLKKLFIKKFGISPTKYIITLKINYACDLLLSGLYTVSQIAEICGYGDLYFFSRQFKEYTGVSPSEYMEKYKSSK